MIINTTPNVVIETQECENIIIEIRHNDKNMRSRVEYSYGLKFESKLIIMKVKFMKSSYMAMI